MCFRKAIKMNGGKGKTCVYNLGLKGRSFFTIYISPFSFEYGRKGGWKLEKVKIRWQNEKSAFPRPFKMCQAKLDCVSLLSIQKTHTMPWENRMCKCNKKEHFVFVMRAGHHYLYLGVLSERFADFSGLISLNSVDSSDFVPA